jgi:hypothetical protein
MIQALQLAGNSLPTCGVSLVPPLAQLHKEQLRLLPSSSPVWAIAIACPKRLKKYFWKKNLFKTEHDVPAQISGVQVTSLNFRESLFFFSELQNRAKHLP